MKKTKRILSVLLVAIMIMVSAPIVGVHFKADALTTVNTGNSDIDKYLNTALSMEGYGQSYFGVDVAWCGYFTWWCASKSGLTGYFQDKAYTWNGDDIIKHIKDKGGKGYYFWDDMYKSEVANDYKLSFKSRSSFTPLPGDIVVFRTSSSSSGSTYKQRWAHVAIVYKVTDSDIYVVHGNWDNKVVVGTKFSRSGSSYYSGSYWLVAGYARPAYKGSVTPTITHNIDTNYATNFTAYPKRKISGSEIYYSDHTMYSSSAWIGTEDKCTIHEVYTDGCCKVSYPGSGGKTVTMYSKYEYFVHTHVYTERYESAHPHKIYNQCECNHYYYTGATKTLSTCAECQKPSNVKLTSDTNSTLHIGQTITLESSASNVDSYKITIQLSGKNVVSTNCGRFYYFKCTSAGTYTAYTTATNSNGSVSSSKITFKVVDHSFDKVVSSTAATCSSTGKTVYACSGILAYNSEKCNATKTVTIEKNTSNHTGGTTVKNKTTATCTKEGYTGDTYCNGCNAKISTGKTIAKISHSYSVTKTIPPTCTEDGYTSYTCKTCGAVKKDNYVSAIGHYDDDADGYCDYCDTDFGTHNPSDNCSHMCHKGGFSGFIWKMLNIFNKMFKTNKTCECGANHY